MNTESDLATDYIVSLTPDFFPNTILFSYILLVFEDEISSIDYKVVHFGDDFLLSFTLA